MTASSWALESLEPGEVSRPLLYSSPMTPQANAVPGVARRDPAGSSVPDTALIPPVRDATRLVERVRGGDRDAEDTLFRRYHRGVLFLLRRLTRDSARAEDLLQETFQIVLERLRSRGLDDPEGLAGFLQGTARRLVLNARRKHQRRKTDTAGDTLPEHPDGAPGPLATTLRGEQAHRVRRLLADLEPERDRQILYRFYLAEDDKGTICADLGLSSLHFNRVLYRARQRFKTLLEAEGWRPPIRWGGTQTP